MKTLFAPWKIVVALVNMVLSLLGLVQDELEVEKESANSERSLKRSLIAKKTAITEAYINSQQSEADLETFKKSMDDLMKVCKQLDIEI